MDLDFQLKGEGDAAQVLRFGAGPQYVLEEIIQERRLTMEESSRGLSILGKDESGVRYAYLMCSVLDLKLTNISVITNFNHLLFVDFSGNLLNLEALQILAGLPFLLYLKAERNRVENAALKIMPYLQVLVLNKNAIGETSDIHQPMLECLELCDNSIFSIQFNPDHLLSLQELILAGNHLIDTSGTFPRRLLTLYLGRNRIVKINTDFSQLPELQYLHLRENNIRKLNGFTSALENLSYLNLRSNKINKIRQFRKLACLPKLETLIFLDNPVYGVQGMPGEGGFTDRGFDTEATDEQTEIFGEGGGEVPIPVDPARAQLLVLLPQLKRINKEPVTAGEREMAEKNRQKFLDEIFAEESSEDESAFPTTTTSGFTSETEDIEEHPVSEQTGEEKQEFDEPLGDQ